jgi:hypothetical protein
VCTGDLIVKHSTSAVDVTSCFYQIKEFWRQLAWPDLVGSYNFVLKIIDVSQKEERWEGINKESKRRLKTRYILLSNTCVKGLKL